MPLANSLSDYSGEFSHWNFSQKVRKRVDQCLVENIAEVGLVSILGGLS